MMKKIIILLGAPGSGKGTQAKLIEKKFNYGHISTGDLLRRLANDEQADPADKLMLAKMQTGQLVDDSLIYKLTFAAIEGYLAQNQGMVLDGAIRNLAQAKKYQEFFVAKNLVDEVVVIELKITDEESFSRLTKRRMCVDCGDIIPWLPGTRDLVACPRCGGNLEPRKDDHPEIASKRIKEQGNEAIKPILDYYNSLGLLKTVEGMEMIEGVEREIEEKIKDY